MKRSKSGFTLIEIIVTLGLLIVVGGVVLLSLGGKRTTVDLANTATQITALLREAQSDSMAQKNGTSWGVHFASDSAQGSYYALFSGSSYASGTVAGQYVLPPDVQFDSSSIPYGTSLDVTFSQLTGAPSAPVSIMLDLVLGGNGGSGGGGGSSASVSRSSSGKIFFDTFNRSTL